MFALRDDDVTGTFSRLAFVYFGHYCSFVCERLQFPADFTTARSRKASSGKLQQATVSWIVPNPIWCVTCEGVYGKRQTVLKHEWNSNWGSRPFLFPEGFVGGWKVSSVH